MLFATNPHRLVSFVVLFLFFLNQAHALPLDRRQSGSTTVQTTRTTQTNAGPLTETCEITLTPVTDKDGKQAVREVRKCSVSIDNRNGGTAGGTSTSSSSDTTSTLTGSVTLSSATSTSSLGSLSIATTTTASITQSSASGSTSTSASASSSLVTSISTSVSSASSSATAKPSSTIQGSSTVTASTTTSKTSSVATLPNTISASTTAQSSNGGTSAADSTTSASSAASSKDASFQIPGKKLSVLPIGLGVFAGISVIALIVVGLVTYERTKYRKAFRQRKLAESGAAMGYGGTVA